MAEITSNRPHSTFGFKDFLWRLCASLALVLVSYNPSGFSYFHWLRATLDETGPGAIHYFIGVILLIGWAIFLIATGRSLGKSGTFLGAALIGTGIWLLTDIGLVSAHSATALTWLTLCAIGILLAIGLSWAHLWRRMSGQLEVDSVDD